MGSNIRKSNFDLVLVNFDFSWYVVSVYMLSLGFKLKFFFGDYKSFKILNNKLCVFLR